MLVYSLLLMESFALCVGTCLLTHLFLHSGFDIPSTFSVLGKQQAYKSARGPVCWTDVPSFRGSVGETDRSFPTGICLNNRR